MDDDDDGAAIVMPSPSNNVAEGRDEQQNSPDEWLMSFRAERAKPILTNLRCLQYIKNAQLQPVTVFCSPTSLTFNVYGKQSQASVDFSDSAFSHYRCASGEGWQSGGEFCVNLPTLLEILGFAQERTKLCCSYNLTKETLQLELLEDNGILTTASIPGMVLDEEQLGNSLALSFRSSPMSARIIVQSEILQQLLVHELHAVSGATVATVALSANRGLVVAAVGHFGECIVSIPAQGRHVVSVEGSAEASWNYALPALLGAMKGLEIAAETCITLNNNGMMAIQHQVIDSETGVTNFVDFILCCLDDDDDEEEEKSEEPPPAPARSPLSSSSVASRAQSARPEDSDSDQELELLALSSAAPLFAAVASRPQVPGNRPQRRRRQTSHHHHHRRPSSSGSSDGDESDRSESQPLDVTAVSSRTNRDGDCSSPELVYGRQY